MKFEKLGSTHFAGGMDLTLAEESLPNGKLARSVNASYALNNRVGPRSGLEEILNLGDILYDIVPMKLSDGTELLALVSALAITIVDHDAIRAGTYSSAEAAKVITGGANVTTTTLRGRLWYGGASDERLWFYDPVANAFYLAGVPAPSAAPTVATGASGVLAGRYKYKYGIVRVVGGQEGYGELSDASAEVAPTSTKVELTALVPWSSPGSGSTLYIDIYRSKFLRDADEFDAYIKIARITQQTIGSVTVATPMVINLTAHGYISNQTVNVVEVGGATNANGGHTITVINANSFSLNSSTAGSAYTSGGKVIATNYSDNATDESIAANQTESGLDGEPADEVVYVESVYDFLFTANDEDRVSVSRVLQPEQVPAASFIDLDAGQVQYGPLVALRNYQDKIYAWKRAATYMLGPGNPELTPPFERVVIDRTRGTINRHAPRSIPQGIMVPGDDNIWLLQGQSYIPIGGPIIDAYISLRESSPTAFNAMRSFAAPDLSSVGLIIGSRVFLLDYTNLADPLWYEWEAMEGTITCAHAFAASTGRGLLYLGVNRGTGQEGSLAQYTGTSDFDTPVTMTLRTGRIGNVGYNLYRRAILRTDGTGKLIFRTFAFGKQCGEDLPVNVTGNYDDGQTTIMFAVWAPTLQVEIETTDVTVRDLVLKGRLREIERGRRA